MHDSLIAGLNTRFVGVVLRNECDTCMFDIVGFSAGSGDVIHVLLRATDKTSIISLLVEDVKDLLLDGKTTFNTLMSSATWFRQDFFSRSGAV